jgi:hypothetical protein
MYTPEHEHAFSRPRPDLEEHLFLVAGARVEVWQEEDGNAAGDEYLATGTPHDLDALVDWMCTQDHWQPIDVEDNGNVAFFIPRVRRVK